MKDPSATRGLDPPTMEQFRTFVGKIVSVPKADIDKEEAKYRKRRKAEKRKALSRIAR
jgi:hypothetical protein